MAISVIDVEAMNMRVLIAKKLHFAVIVRARIWLPLRNQPYASSRLPTIFPSPKHVNFISIKINLQHQQPQTLMQQQQRHHAPSRVLLARQT